MPQGIIQKILVDFFVWVMGVRWEQEEGYDVFSNLLTFLRFILQFSLSLVLSLIS